MSDPVALPVLPDQLHCLESGTPAGVLSDPADVVYGPSTRLVRGRLDVVRLQEALNAVAGRHDALRVSFQRQGASWVQIVRAAVELPLTIHPQANTLHEALERVKAWALAPFDLTVDPLAKALLVPLNKATFVFCIAVHHIIIDATALQIILDDIWRHYRHEVDCHQTDVMSYAEWLVQENAALADEAYVAPRLAYWRNEVSRLPVDGETRTTEAAIQWETIPKRVMAAMRASDTIRSSTPFSRLAAAYMIALWHEFAWTHVGVTSTITRRDRLECAGLVAPLWTWAVASVAIDSCRTYSDVAHEVTRATLDAMEHALPFHFVREDREKRGLPQPLAPGFYLLGQEVHATIETVENLVVEPTPQEFVDRETTTDGLVGLNIFPRSPRTRVYLCYSIERLGHVAATRLLANWLTILEAASRSSDLPLASLPDRLRHLGSPS